jgi:signal transduction histidine kinase
MTPHRLRWLIFLSAGALLAVALGWVTWAALDLEKRGFAERAENLEQELSNMALARIEAAVTTILARENQRPPQHYLPFYEPESAFNLESRVSVDPAGYYYPSPLLRRAPGSDFVELYFTLLPDGSLSSPQLPQEEYRQLALEQGLVTQETLDRGERLLQHLRARLELPSLLAAVDRLSPLRRPQVLEESPQPIDLLALMEDADERERRAEAELRFRNFLARHASGGEVAAFVPHLLPAVGAQGLDLVFLRDLRFGEQRGVQGFWVAWPQLETFLLRLVRDLYPKASIVPTRTTTGGARLVTIPFSFDAGAARDYRVSGLTPTRLALLGLWAALLAAALAVGVTLQKTFELSERRRSFVSAVTHELRTPLTTFCMYSELLADGIVTDPAAQREYFATLKEESVRLRRIVENVLGYARLEGPRSERPLETIDAEELVERVLPALERRAAEAGLDLVPDLCRAAGFAVEVDVQAVEQILFNLVDNACKYAAESVPEIRLEVEAARGRLFLRVLDHGPGIPASVRSVIFAPFRRAAGEAAGVIPGIGLGLSLARGMARGLGGDVTLIERAGYGAVFELWLPLLAPNASSTS